MQTAEAPHDSEKWISRVRDATEVSARDHKNKQAVRRRSTSESEAHSTSVRAKIQGWLRCLGYKWGHHVEISGGCRTAVRVRVPYACIAAYASSEYTSLLQP